MKSTKKDTLTTIGLVFLIMSMVLFKDALKWSGFVVALVFLILGLSNRIRKEK